MEELFNFFKEQITLIGDYPTWLYLATGVAVMILTQVLKVPFKKLISNKIKNNNLRRKVNLIFMLLPILLAIGINYGFSFLDYTFNVSAGISSGFLAEFLYEFFKTLFARCKQSGDITNDDIRESTKAAKTKVKAEKDTLKSESEKLDEILKRLA